MIHHGLLSVLPVNISLINAFTIIRGRYDASKLKIMEHTGPNQWKYLTVKIGNIKNMIFFVRTPFWNDYSAPNHISLSLQFTSVTLAAILFGFLMYIMMTPCLIVNVICSKYMDHFKMELLLEKRVRQSSTRNNQGALCSVMTCRIVSYKLLAAVIRKPAEARVLPYSADAALDYVGVIYRYKGSFRFNLVTHRHCD